MTTANIILYSRAMVVSMATVVFSLVACGESKFTDPEDIRGDSLTTEEEAFLTDLHRRTFQFFWDTTPVNSCLAVDRWPSKSSSSIAATGFAISAFIVGAENGYVPRDEAANRIRNCLEFYTDLPQGPASDDVSGHKGLFYHFLDPVSGHRWRNSELSTIDTALFVSGVLFAQSYFDRQTTVEKDIRQLSEELYRSIEWPTFIRASAVEQAVNATHRSAITMGWRPERGYEDFDWVGYNEGMILYILALGSPTYSLDPISWTEGWSATLKSQWKEFGGQEHLAFGPLFGHQYSHIFIDFKGIKDAFMRGVGIDYHENSKRALLSQKAYAKEQEGGWRGYTDFFWGLTASDGPGYQSINTDHGRTIFDGYAARGIAANYSNDDGTVAPTALGGSIPFAPKLTVSSLLLMKKQFGKRLYQKYGFKDSINLDYARHFDKSQTGTVYPGEYWVANDYLGIDQGPILLMIENYRTGLIWETLKKNKHIRRGLEQAGFEGGWLDE